MIKVGSKFKCKKTGMTGDVWRLYDDGSVGYVLNLSYTPAIRLEIVKLATFKRNFVLIN